MTGLARPAALSQVLGQPRSSAGGTMLAANGTCVTNELRWPISPGVAERDEVFVPEQ